MATTRRTASKATKKAGGENTAGAASKGSTGASGGKSGGAKAAATTAKKQTGRVVEDLGNGLAAVYPTDQADYKKLAVELLQAANQPGDVQTHSMPRRFVAPADLVKKALGA